MPPTCPLPSSSCHSNVPGPWCLAGSQKSYSPVCASSPPPETGSGRRDPFPLPSTPLSPSVGMWLTRLLHGLHTKTVHLLHPASSRPEMEELVRVSRAGQPAARLRWGATRRATPRRFKINQSKPCQKHLNVCYAHVRASESRHRPLSGVFRRCALNIRIVS